MQGRPREIAASQLVMLLTLSRLFTLFTFASKPDEGFTGSRALLVIPLAAVGSLVIIIPYLLLKKRAGADLLTAAWRVGKPWGIAVSGAFCLFSIYMVGQTTGLFTFFMVSTVYQTASVWMMIPLFLLVAGYTAKLGLEAFSRAGTFLFVICTVIGLSIVLALVPEIDLSYISSPMHNGSTTVLSATMQAVASNTDILLFILFLPRVKNGSGKTYFWWVLVTLIFWWVMIFIVLTALGDYADTRMFPLYSAAAAAKFSLFGRMDLLHITVWIVTAFLRTSAWLYGGTVCLRRIFPKLSMGGGVTLCAVAAGALALATMPDINFWRNVANYLPVIFIILVVGIPLVTALIPRAKSPVSEPAERGENAI